MLKVAFEKPSSVAAATSYKANLCVRLRCQVNIWVKESKIGWAHGTPLTEQAHSTPGRALDYQLQGVLLDVTLFRC